MVKDGIVVDDKGMTFGEYLERYMKDVGAHTLRPKTHESYTWLIRKHIKPGLGRRKLSALQPHHIQEFYSKKLEEGLSRRSVQYMHAVIRKALNQAVQWGLVKLNVSNRVTAPRPKKKTPETLSVGQAKTLLDHVRDHPLYPVYLMALTTGMRQGEILGLYWEDIDFDKGQIHVRRSAQYLRGKGIVITDPKTKNAKRTIAMPDVLAGVLQAMEPGTGLVFRTGNGTPYSPRNVLRHFQDSLKAVGLPRIRFHDLRHTAATQLLADDVHPKIVQEMLGHSSIALTLDTYSHVLPAVRRKASNSMDKLYGEGEED